MNSLMKHERDPNFYIPDGNIVLGVVQAEGATYFRVHKSTLAKYSPVFREMFSVPLPSHPETYDNVHLVWLHDPLDALRSFLGFLYDP